MDILELILLMLCSIDDKKPLVLSLINCEPLSQTISDGTPNLHKILRLIKDITSLDLTCQNASALIHLEK